MRVVVSGGGTGGHIFPAIAVAESVQRLAPTGDVLYIGGTTGMETQIVPKYGIQYQAVTAKKLRKVMSPSTVGVMLSLVRGYGEAKAYLKAFRADAVVGTGGYVAAATTLAGVHLKLPTVILESNVRAGRTNKWLAKWVQTVCLSFPQTAKEFPSNKTQVTGLPLRSTILAPQDVTKGDARQHFEGLTPDRFTVVIIGGSQGAQAINGFVLAAAESLISSDVQILHQTGARNFEEVSEQAASRGLTSGYRPLPFLDETQVPLALRAADVLVCRGGISTLSEAMVNALPALIVPLPTAYADHQTENARAVEQAGGGMLRPEGQWSGKAMAAEIVQLKQAPQRLAAMSAGMTRIARPDAADAVANLVLLK
jgi:UDP-N-acetylglucosamine--N-acetylmuramyl-(pentapeptide) pyrophosphoryl-undecaprenol N-acetylglucosamine transferase